MSREKEALEYIKGLPYYGCTGPICEHFTKIAELLESEPPEPEGEWKEFSVMLQKHALKMQDHIVKAIKIMADLTAELKDKEEIINLLQEYIKLLGDELDEIVGYAYSRGWRSSRVEKGKELRAKIKQALKGEK